MMTNAEAPVTLLKASFSSLVLLVWLTVCAISIAGSIACSISSAQSLSTSKTLKAVNTIRIQHKLVPLKLHPSLQKAAQHQSRLMAKAGKMSHKVGWRNSFAARMKRVGYGGLAAENIAYGQSSLDRVLRAWMNSRGHRRNMLHPRMRYFGLAYSTGKGLKYWTMVLGG